MRPRILLAALGAVASTMALAAPAGAVTPGWECIPATAGQAVVSGGTGSSPACAGGTTPVLAPTYVASGVGAKPTVQFAAVNVQILNGAGTTATKNGKGNLVVGYDESPGTQSGSHNVVLGSHQTFTSYAGLLGGSTNTVTGPFGAVFGIANKAVGPESLAAGNNNQAVGTATSAIGGYKNVANANSSSITGGCANLTGSGAISALPICGDNAGHPNNFASISGGYANHATGVSSSIIGGQQNLVSDPFGFGPSDVTDVQPLDPSGSSAVTSGPGFLSSRVVHFTDSRTFAEVTGSLGYLHATGTSIDAVLGVCYQPAAGGAITQVSFVKPSFDSNQLNTFVQSVSGIVQGLAPGDYRIGLCAQSESANVQHGFGAGTLILGESNTVPPPPPPPCCDSFAATRKRR
jgi:hypothetical protein